MLSEYVTRGAAAGLVAGVVFGGFVAFVGDPLVALAEGLAHEHGHHEATALAGATSVAAGVVWGVLAGLLLGVAYYFLEPALPGAPDTRSYLLAAGGFVTVSGAPWLVLPPRPAGVEHALGTDVRLFWYGTMMVAGAAACVLAVLAYRRAERTGVPAVVALLPFGLLAVPVLLAPANPVGATADGFVAAYRGVVGVGQLLFWGTLASAHAWLCRRSVGPVDGDPGREPVVAD